MDIQNQCQNPVALFIAFLKSQYAKGYGTINPCIPSQKKEASFNQMCPVLFGVQGTEVTNALMADELIKLVSWTHSKWAPYPSKGTPNFILTEKGQKHFGLVPPARDSIITKTGENKINKSVEMTYTRMFGKSSKPPKK